jgi:hypothetical protein
MRVDRLLGPVGLVLALGCNRAPTPPPAVAPEPNAPVVPPPPPPPAAPAAEASGPRQEITEPSFVLTAALTPGANAAAPASLAVELRGAGHFHVNELYPTSLELDVRDGSTDKPSMRRADAAEHTQSVARFVAPVTRAGTRTVVLGRLRFAVCSAENCVPESRNFAVAIQ